MTAPKKGWFQRLTDGLSRSSKQMTEQVVSTFTKQPLDQAKLDELEEMLIEADLGHEAAARAETAEAERVAAEQRAQALARMTPQAQAIETLRQDCADWAAKLPPHGNFRKQLADANKLGLYQDATRLVKTALQSPDWSADDKAALAEVLLTHLSQAVAPWDAKEQRKKLQLAQLRGEA